MAARASCLAGVQQYCDFIRIMLSVSNTTYDQAEANITCLRRLLFISKMLLKGGDDYTVSDETYNYVTAVFVRIRYHPPFDADQAISEPLTDLAEYLSKCMEYNPLKEWVSKILPKGSLQVIVDDISEMQ